MAKIMLVEDDENLREIYGARLQAENYETVAVSDGEQALASVVKEKPDLIILDVMMPKISGFDVLDILRATPETKDTKVIMMTALSQDTDRQRGENLGADRYLVKSQVTLEDVVNTVHDVLTGVPSTQTVPAPAPAPEPASTTAQPPAPTPPAPVAPNPAPTTTQSAPSIATPPIATQQPAVPAPAPAPEPASTTAQPPAPTPPNTTVDAPPPRGYSSPKPEAGIDIAPPPTRVTVPVRKPPTNQLEENQHTPPPPQPRPETRSTEPSGATNTTDVSSETKPAQSNDKIVTAETNEQGSSSQDTTNPQAPQENPQPETEQNTAKPDEAQSEAETEEVVNAPVSTTELHFSVPDSPSRKKKVIQPINDPTQKPDLRELARIELAKQQQTNESHQVIDGGLSETTAQEKTEVENQIHSFMADSGSNYQEKQQQMTPGQTITPGSAISEPGDSPENSDQGGDQIRPEDIAL